MNDARVTKSLGVALLAVVVLSAAQAKQTFTGIVTDSECEKADHARMRMGDTDAECVKACVDAHGAAYVLYDGQNVYALSDQRTAATFAARRVRVVGTLKAGTKSIDVESMSAAR